MGITAKLKQISTETLELLKRDEYLVELFFNSRWLPESDFWVQSQWSGESAEKTKQEARERFGKLSFRQNLKRNIRCIFNPM